MTRIDLDDLPPKIAAQLSAVAQGEEVILVRNGAVIGRLTGGALAAPPAEAAPDAEIAPGEIFEQFRASIEDEF